MITENLRMVEPKASPYPEYTAYLKNIASGIVIGYSIVIIVVIMLVLTVSRYIKLKKIKYFRCAVDVLNLLMNDNTAIRYQQLTYSELILIVPLTFAGFVIANGFLSIFKSYLTQPINQPQIETLEDLYRSPILVLVHNEFWLNKEINLLKNASKYENWSEKMRVLEYSEIVRQMLTNVTTVSFTEFESLAIVICRYVRLHVTQKRLQWIWYSYNVRYDFPFTERVNEIFLNCCRILKNCLIRLKDNLLIFFAFTTAFPSFFCKH